MKEALFTLDGEEFDVSVVTLRREFAIGQKGETFMTQDGGYHRLVMGTYYHYTMTVRAKPGLESELERFWKKVSQPVERILCRFPYGQSYLQQEMYVMEGAQNLQEHREANRWDQIVVRFLGALPQVVS